jgi:hypothetical protein
MIAIGGGLISRWPAYFNFFSMAKKAKKTKGTKGTVLNGVHETNL